MRSLKEVSANQYTKTEISGMFEKKIVSRLPQCKRGETRIEGERPLEIQKAHSKWKKSSAGVALI